MSQRTFTADRLVPSQILAVVVFAGTAGLGGCCEGVMCDVCGGAIHVDATDAQTGDPIEESECVLASDGRSCTMVTEPGSYAVEVSAPGYGGVVKTVTVPASDGDGCCDCGYDYVTVTVELDPR